MAFERKITPAAYLIGSANRATLKVTYRDINGKRRTLTLKGIGSYRLREDGSLFSVRKSEGAGVRNALSVRYGTRTEATIKVGQGRPMVASDVRLTLSEGTYTVVTA